MGIIKSLTKLAVGGGVVYVTVEKGIWKNQQETTEAYHKIVNSIPYLKIYIEKIPSVDISKQEVATYWNSGVKSCFSALASLPSYSKEGVWKGFDSLKELIKSQMGV